MKKTLAFMMCVIIVLCLVACGDNSSVTQPSDPDTSTITPSVESTDNNSETAIFTTPSKDEYESYVKIGGKSIYVNYKNGRRDDVGASSVVLHSTAVDMTAVVYEVNQEFSGTYKDVFALLNDGRIFKDIAMYADADFNDYSKTYIMETKTTKDVKVNDNDMQQFEAVVKDANGRECYVYGYAFVVEGVPCMVTGFVLSAGQEQSLTDSVKTEVSTMVETVRTKR